MSKKCLPPLYKIGEYITGIDRSYPRSIYIYRGMNKWQTKVAFELVVYDSHRGNGEHEYFPAKIAEEYRLATREELLESGAICKSVDFITHA